MDPRALISVCVCTFKRPHYLKRLLEHLINQSTEDLFRFSITVADNDVLESARAVVLECARDSAVPLRYCVEPEQNIALARNRAVSKAEGELIAFIDDDEFPAKDWLATLYKALVHSASAGVLGPVRPFF